NSNCRQSVAWRTHACPTQSLVKASQLSSLQEVQRPHNQKGRLLTSLPSVAAPATVQNSTVPTTLTISVLMKMMKTINTTMSTSTTRWTF
ncbi:unnamed protein product, partial [Aphanomyces euteiches]